MKQVNFNLNGLIQNIRINVGKKDEGAVEAIVEKAVESAIQSSNSNLLGKDVKLDTVEFHTKKEEVVIDSVSVVQPVQTEVVVNIDDDGNIFTEQDDADTAKLNGNNVVFGSLVAKKVTPSVPVDNTDETGGVNKGGENHFYASFDILVAGWDAYVEAHANDPDGGYQAKLDRMDKIIYAAEQNVNKYLAEHPELDLDSHPPYRIPSDANNDWDGYWALKDQASEWRCYKFMLINSTLREQFREYSINLYYGLMTYDQIEFPNDFLPDGEILDYSDIEFGQILATGYVPDMADFEEFNYFGGHSEGTENGCPGYYVPNTNNEQRYIYSMAILAVYQTKMIAAELRLRDEYLSGPAKDLLRQNLAYFRLQIRNIQTALAEIRANLAMEQNMNQGSDDFTSYLESLFPEGIVADQVDMSEYALEDDPIAAEAYAVYADYLGVPEDPTQQPDPDSLAVQIKNNPDAYMQEIQWLYNHAKDQFERETRWQNEHPRRFEWHLHDASFWQNQMQIWQRILNGGNTSRAGDVTP